MKRNLTVQLDEDVIRQAKVIAARRGTSVSGLVAQHIEEMIAADERYQRARQRALEALETVAKEAAARGAEPSTRRTWRREDAYDRTERFAR